MTVHFDSTSFRRALGNFATGVIVVTAQDEEGNKVGMTANSFTSVSLDPPLVLWCIDKRANSYAVFNKVKHFAVNILAVDQIDISNNFARSKEDRFKDITYKEGIGRSLLIDDVSAQFECELMEQIDAGDHIILLGKVISFNDFGRVPLLYHQGAYSSVFPHPSLRKKAMENNRSLQSEVNNRLSDNIHYLLTQAVRTYQDDYYPKQLASGLRNSEARILLVLSANLAEDKLAISKEANVPVREIDQALEILMNKKLIEISENRIALTLKGQEQAQILFSISEEHQAEVLARYQPDEVKLFKKMLQEML